MKVLDKLKLWQKFALVTVALWVPIGHLGYIFVSSAQEKVRFAAREVRGVEYLVPLRGVLESVAAHRGLVNAMKNGNDGLEVRAAAAREAVGAAIAEADAANGRHGETLEVSEIWRAIVREWQGLASGVSTMSAEESFAAHDKLVGRILSLFGQVGDTSNLILDPILESYYLIGVVVSKAPALAEEIGLLRGRSAGLVGRTTLTDRERAELISAVTRIRSLAGAVDRSFGVAFENDSSLEAKLGAQRARLNGAVREFLRVVEDRVIPAGAIAATTVERVLVPGTAAIDATFAAYDATAPVLVGLLEARLAGFETELFSDLAVVLVAVVLALALVVLTCRTFQRSLRHAREVFSRIGAGQYDNAIEAGAGDEVGDLLDALRVMQDDLREKIEIDRRKAAETSRLKQALDSVTASVMVADPDNEIIYANDAVMELFRNAESDLRQDLPGFSASAVVGRNIDIFHKNPGHQRNLLAGMQGAHRADFEVGGRSFRIAATPVFAEGGERLGTVVEWADRTQELAAQDEVARVVSAARAGSLDERIDLAGKTGFFSVLSEGMNDLLDVSQQVMDETVRVLGAVARGDLTQTIEAEFEGSFGQLKADANATVEKLTEVIGRIKESADSVNSGSQEIAAGNGNLSQRTEEQAATLEETASSMEEMTSTVRQNADNANQANQLAEGARDQAERGGTVVGDAIRAMQAIDQSSQKIADIIGVIDEIAFQTNLLALNAAVEAARAGEQGRGFAVVASEVRNLAGRSATAAKEIKELIEDSASKVQDGSRLVDDSGRTLEEIVTAVHKVTEIVAEIAAASREQSAGIEQVNKAVMGMDEMTQQNAALVEEAASAAAAMGDQARDLHGMVSFFVLDEDRRKSVPPAEAPAASTADDVDGPAPGQGDRRRTGRPWSEVDAPTWAPAAPAAAAAPVPWASASGGDADDGEWEEF